MNVFNLVDATIKILNLNCDRLVQKEVISSL
jgi:hypothetical protein